MTNKKSVIGVIQDILEESNSDIDDFEPDNVFQSLKLNTVSSNKREEMTTCKTKDTGMKICKECFCTIENKTHCLKWQQNKEYNKSLRRDQEKEKEDIAIDDEI